MKKDFDIYEFLKAVADCTGQVSFETEDGDCLVLTSILSQYIFGSIAASPELLNRGHIICREPSDYEILSDFLCRN